MGRTVRTGTPDEQAGRGREEDGKEVGRARDTEPGDGTEGDSGDGPPSRLPLALLSRLTPAALREPESDELRLYVGHLDPHGGPLTLRDLERAALMHRRELKIMPEVWGKDEAALGWFDALVALIVVDANRDHPKTPMRNPGGLLRDLAHGRRAGTLDLAASVVGTWKRTSDGGV